MAGVAIPLRILVVEDDDIAAEYLSLHLMRLGCEVETATDGEGGLAKLLGSRFDVLISDWMMPRMDGLELIRRAREAIDHYLHVILLTAPGEERTMAMAMAAGADDFLYKPITPVKLELGVATARRVLGLQRRLERRNRSLATAMDRVRRAYRQLKTDIEAAAAMQLSLIPRDGTTGLLEHAAFIQPSIDMGGDSFGVAELESGTFFFAIDVSGHGVPAALNSFAVHQRVLQLAREGTAISEIARTINAELIDQPGDSYATALFGITTAPDEVRLLRCGHPPPVIQRHDACRLVEEGALPLGMLADQEFAGTAISLSKGERLVCYSDGVMESGMDEPALLEFCRANSHISLPQFTTQLKRRLAEFRGSRAPADDISVLAIERRAGDERE